MSCLNAGTGAPGLIKGSSEQIHAPFQQLKKVKKEDDDKLLTGVPLKQLKTVKQERVDGDDFHFQREKRMDFWGLAVKEEYPDKSPVNSPFQQLKTVKKEHADSDDSPAKLHMDFFRPVLKEESPVKDPFRQLKAVKQENHDGIEDGCHQIAAVMTTMMPSWKHTMRTPAKGTGREEDSDRDLADFIVDDSDVTESDEDVCYPDLSRRLNFADLPSRKSRLPASQRKGNRKPRDPVFIGSSESSEESDNDTDDSEREEDNVFNSPLPRSATSSAGYQTPDANQLKWYTPATSMKTKPRRGISVGDCTPSARDFPSAGQQSKNRQVPSWTTPSLAAKRSTCTGNATVTHFSFLRSLSADTPDHRRDPEARRFISQFRQRREEISSRLFKLFNTTIFDNQLPADMGIVWNKRLLKTAGRCKEKRIGDRREAAIELSVKVCDSAERARDTLVHEMCHAAVWLISGVKEGHGPHWKYWARKANKVHPEIPIIQRCHDYTISTKYIYRCTKCGYQIGRHSKSLDTDRKICGRCRGQFQLLLASAGGAASDGSACPTPRTPRTPNPFAMFVKENYGSVKKQGLSHKEVMNQLSKDFAEKNKI
nr:hypothetical protein BaRGS_015945 [Batillaria attramentaria]